MADRGRPTSFNQKTAGEICERLAAGESLRSICRSDDMPSATTVFNWLMDERYSGFLEQYTRARDFQADLLFDEMLDIADDGSNDWMEREGREVLNGEHVQRSKLRVDTRKWFLGKVKPKKYGDFQRNEISGPDGGPVGIAAIEFVNAGNGQDTP